MKLNRKSGIIIAVLFLVAFFAYQQQANLRHAEETDFGTEDHIAVIRVDGPIVGDESVTNLFNNNESASSTRLMRDFRRVLDDPHAKVVLLRINSPGGSATATEEIGTEMDRVKAAGKKIIVSMGDSCASGGYWLAAKGDTIFANPTTLTGSIGVYIGYTNYQELMEKIGIRNDRIKSGAHKDILSPDRPMTEEERSLIQGMVDDIYQQFVHVVAIGRHMDETRVRELADGRIFTGKQAKELGLVDELGNYYDALAYAAKEAGLNDARPKTVEYATEPSWKQIFSMQMNNALGRMWTLPESAPRIQAQWEGDMTHAR